MHHKNDSCSSRGETWPPSQRQLGIGNKWKFNKRKYTVPFVNLWCPPRGIMCQKILGFIGFHFHVEILIWQTKYLWCKQWEHHLTSLYTKDHNMYTYTLIKRKQHVQREALNTRIGWCLSILKNFMSFNFQANTCDRNSTNRSTHYCCQQSDLKRMTTKTDTATGLRRTINVLPFLYRFQIQETDANA